MIRAKCDLGLSAQRIYQDLVAENGFVGSYYGVRRFVLVSAAELAVSSAIERFTSRYTLSISELAAMTASPSPWRAPPLSMYGNGCHPTIRLNRGVGGATIPLDCCQKPSSIPRPKGVAGMIRVQATVDLTVEVEPTSR